MKYSPSFRIWFNTWIAFCALLIMLGVFVRTDFVIPFICGLSLILSAPSGVAYMIAFWLLNRIRIHPIQKFYGIVAATGGIAALYAIPLAAVFAWNNMIGNILNLEIYFPAFLMLFVCGLASVLWNRERILSYFSPEMNFIDPSTTTETNRSPHKNQTNMDPFTSSPEPTEKPGNKTMIKGMITGGLILLLLIPTIFITNLIQERQLRQAEVVKDVSSKWATAQTITGPYIFIRYKTRDKDGKETAGTKELVFLPDNLEVSGNIVPEQRLRSIYKVLLYKSQLNSKGNFILQLPKEVDPASLVLNEAKICVGITDFKGIEKKIEIRLNDSNYILSPGLPTDFVDETGLSASIDLKPENFGKSLSFSFPLQIKGSEQLHFVPLSGNSQFTISSVWANPSFDGNSIPSERNVGNNGFQAKWEFNKANLPFGTVLENKQLNKQAHAFGISMIQPADQYAKTTRSVKYAILIIGLTLSLFFITELMQKKPVHPVQYVLIGLALVIFYTLLLSISEFVLFDLAYLIAAVATILLITLYAKGHFKSWKTAGIFASLMSGLYGFIFVLISLEDTALLVGSIGLFIVLALVMYVSRKINWYQPETMAVQ
ncbi:cell envelope integrity protein CreD [Sediminibacterium roseum]|uniref:Cell envelope integrity protein CreD n=1 Tax=Sediminibacterium roseum TaxID=1978412 RepID=A0ABW9ZQX9_9BACT|nr:cell envelope integrity protein CreD [Sediminibacterium roseum]NCI48694.1 cell envelope integrity protein CreD [Sediminibacterium roseum]